MQDNLVTVDLDLILGAEEGIVEAFEKWKNYFNFQSPLIFLKPFWPLMEFAYNHLSAYIKSITRRSSKLVFEDQQIREIIYKDFVNMLLNKVTRVFILELNSARTKNFLQGETSEERFDYFMTCLCNKNHLMKLLNKYPLLSTHIRINIQQYIVVMTEFLLRLYDDFDLIEKNFLAQKKVHWQLTSIKKSGDTHQQGRAVAFIELIANDASKCEIVYKPRSTQADKGYDEFINWANQYFTLKLVLPKHIYKANHGWLEVIKYKSCENKTQVKSYYKRLGYLLAIMYLLCGSDIHFENVIASGEDPIIVDLECLFTPIVDTRDNREEILNDHFLVIDTFFLPIKQMVDDNSIGVDFSAFGGKGGDLTPHTSIETINFGKDNMSIERKQVYLDQQENIPKLNGETIDPKEYESDFIAGFKEGYQLFLKHKSFLLGEDSPLKNFREIKTRAVLRNTASYSKLLFESYHPKILYDQMEWNKHFAWLNEEFSSQYLDEIINAELRDLAEGNIPIFYSMTNEKYLYDSYSNKMNVRVLKTGYEHVMFHICNHLNDLDYEKQLNCIKQTFAAYRANEQDRKEKFTYKKGYSDITKDNYKERCIAIAENQLNLIMKHCVESESVLCWVGIEYVHNKVWRPGRINTSLYDGLAGIALCFAYAGKVLNNVVYRDFAYKAYQLLKNILLNTKSIKGLTIGAFSGMCGLIYVLHCLYQIWRDKDIINTLDKAIQLFLSISIEKAELDIIGGISGALTVLDRCKEYFDTAILHDVQNRLLQKFFELYPHPYQISTSSSIKVVKPLIGFAHGTTGMILTLFRYAKTFPEVSVWIEEALAYERSTFSIEIQNWPDYRMLVQSDKNENQFMTAWCHGATGIGLARLKMLENDYRDQHIESEITSALFANEKDFGGILNLCHGDCGRLELFLNAYQQNFITIDQLLNHISFVTNYIDNHTELMYENLEEVFIPGLLTGAAGVAYEFLRLAHPDKIPSVLLLEDCKI